MKYWIAMCNACDEEQKLTGMSHGDYFMGTDEDELYSPCCNETQTLVEIETSTEITKVHNDSKTQWIEKKQYTEMHPFVVGDLLHYKHIIREH